MGEIIEFDNKRLQNFFKEFLRVVSLTSSDLEEIPGCVELTYDDDGDEISQHDIDILLKYIKVTRFSKYNFTNIVFKGNGTNKISFTECTFNECTFKDVIVLTQVDEDFSRYGNSKIEVEINNLKQLHDICKFNNNNICYSFKIENDMNKQVPIMQSYSMEEIKKIDNIFQMIQSIVPSNISNLDKLLIVSTLLCKNLVIDDRGDTDSEEYNRLSEKEKNIYRSLVVTFKGSLLMGIAVCVQYGVCLKWALEAVGINSRTVCSSNHMWNQIDLNGDGTWYNFCLTNLRDFFKNYKKFYPALFLTCNKTISELGNSYILLMEGNDCILNYEYDIRKIINKIQTINGILNKEMPLRWETLDPESKTRINSSLEEFLEEI